MNRAFLCTAAGPWIGGTWTNWGGDKAWVWPQDGWPARIGRKWPDAPLPADGRIHGRVDA